MNYKKTRIQKIYEMMAEFEQTHDGYSVLLQLMVSSEILKRLDALGWTQRELAVRLGVSQPVVSRIIDGSTFTRIDTLGRIMHVLGIPPSAIKICSTDESGALTRANGGGE